MNPFEPEEFEQELRGLNPAQPPKAFLDRLTAELSSRLEPSPSLQETPPRCWNWRNTLRWLVPVSAAGGLATVLLLGLRSEPQASKPVRSMALAPARAVKADKIEIDQQLLADFDAVAQLPSGEPVRFRCQQWMYKVRLRDSASGVVIERSAPRLEIVPVTFETY